MTPKSLLTIILLVGGLFVTVLLFEITTIHGNEYGVKETWADGVVETPLPSKTYFLFPGFTQKIYAYDMGMQRWVMNDKAAAHEKAEGRASDSYLVQSKDQQDMRISLQVQWQRDPAHVVQLHKIARDDVEERLLRPEVMRVVKDEATRRTALEAYSGEGLVNLQNEIERRLSNPAGELRQRGVHVAKFVIEHIGLDPKYTEQIVARQVAIQAKLRADEETKTAIAQAEKAKADAQANYEKVLVEARRDKEQAILNSEAKKQQAVLAAEADAQRVALAAEAEKAQNVLKAEGEQQAGVLRAQAILALGKAEAEAQKLRLSAYAVPGADAFVKVEISKQLAAAFGNVRGFLPPGVNYTTVARDFEGAASLLVTPTTDNGLQFKSQ
jgi:regulator of protease activity HflC (stomatin/prohibitin superfamily)